MAKADKKPFTGFKKVISNPDAIDPEMKLKLTDVEEANEPIIREVAGFFGKTIGQTEEVITFLGKYTKDLVEKGQMETIMYPGFGKITPNVKQIRAKIRRLQDLANNKYILTLALRGKNIKYYPEVNPVEKPPSDETV